MPTGQSDQALTRSPHVVSPVGDGGFGVSNGRRCAVNLTVTMSHNDTACTIEAEGLNYSLIQLLEAVEDE